MLRAFLLLLTAFALPVAASDEGWGPWNLVWGEPNGAHIDVSIKKDRPKAVFASTYWQFRNQSKSKLRVQYDWTAGNGKVNHSSVDLDPEGLGGDNNCAGGIIDPQIRITSVQTRGGGSSSSGSPAAGQGQSVGNTVVDPGPRNPSPNAQVSPSQTTNPNFQVLPGPNWPASTGSTLVFPGPKVSPSPKQ
jgi:hypothetical protein